MSAKGERPEAPARADARPARASRPVRPITLATLLFLVVLLGVLGARSWGDLDRAREREAELAAKVAETEERIETLERRIERIRHDPMLLERLAREELGLVKEGEVVFVLPEDGKDE